MTAFGQTLAQAFSNAAYGLFSIITDLRKVRKVESRTVEIQADNLEDLLFAWLNNLIYLFDAEQILVKRFDIQMFEKCMIRRVCLGEKVDPIRNKMKQGIKAATYHLLKVDAQKNQLCVIFDL